MAGPAPPRAADAARQGPPRAEEHGGGQGAAAVVKEEAEEVKIRALMKEKLELEVEEVKVRAVEWVGEGGKRRRVKREVVVAKAGPSGRGAGRQQAGNARRGTSRFPGVNKLKGRKAKPWVAEIQVTEDGKRRRIHIGTFAREEDAARAYDRVNIAKLGHAEAKTNFLVAEYRAEWAELEALGVDGVVALMMEHAAAERQDVMNKASRFRGVTKVNGGKGAKPWAA